MDIRKVLLDQSKSAASCFARVPGHMFCIYVKPGSLEMGLIGKQTSPAALSQQSMMPQLPLNLEVAYRIFGMLTRVNYPSHVPQASELGAATQLSLFLHFIWGSFVLLTYFTPILVIRLKAVFVI